MKLFGKLKFFPLQFFFSQLYKLCLLNPLASPLEDCDSIFPQKDINNLQFSCYVIPNSYNTTLLALLQHTSFNHCRKILKQLLKIPMLDLAIINTKP